ncbi:MAG TPA: hypothetical protein PK587_09860, partial [Syntrophales bacterium]|nr:hypothetical protein [Syntrophales bacterium]
MEPARHPGESPVVLAKARHPGENASPRRKPRRPGESASPRRKRVTPAKAGVQCIKIDILDSGLHRNDVGADS